MPKFLKDKTFFILTDGTAETYYGINISFNNSSIHDIKPEIIVYDRNSTTGLKTLNKSDVVDILTEGSPSYNDRLNRFVEFLFNTLGEENNDLYKLAISLLKGDKSRVSLMVDEDVCLADDFRNAIQNLKLCEGVDTSLISYFEEKYVNQEFIWWRYSQKWIDSLSTNTNFDM